jgi:hypothetical protein
LNIRNSNFSQRKPSFFRTTKGWKLCVLWKGGSSSCEPLAGMKEAFPINVAEFAVAHNLQDRNAFKWWVPHALKL